jgi:hypothetical protein
MSGIDTDEDYSPPNDNSGAGPVMATPAAPDDNSGAAPVMPTPQPQQPVADQVLNGINESGAAASQASAGPPQVPMPDTSGAGQPPVGQQAPGAQGGQSKGIVSYVGGADAVSPQTLAQGAAAVDPGKNMSPGDANILAVKAAYDKGGEAAAWAVIQGNRVAYNAKQAFAYTAASGIQNKPADMNAAMDAANQAEQHVLDGSNVHFAPGTGGIITATVTMPGTKKPIIMNLTPEQFKAYLDIGQSGQYDKVTAKGVPATLAEVAKQQSQGAQGPDFDAQGHYTKGEDANNPYNAPRDAMGRSQAADPWARQFNDKYGEERTKFDKNSDDELMYRANRQFPQMGQDREKQEWIAKQQGEEAGRQNKLDVATQEGVNKRDIADITARGRQGVAQTNKEGKVEATTIGSGNKLKGVEDTNKSKAGQQAGVQDRATMETARKSIASKEANGIALTPEETALKAQFTKSATRTPGAAAPQAATPQASAPTQRPPNVPQGARFHQGKWYTRGPNGEAVPVQ